MRHALSDIFAKSARYSKQLIAGLSVAVAATFAPASEVAADAPEAPAATTTTAAPAPEPAPYVYIAIPEQSAYSKDLKAMEAEANAYRSANRPAVNVAILDYDAVMLRLAREGTILRYMITDQLKDRGLVSQSPQEMLKMGVAGAAPVWQSNIKPDDLNFIRDGFGGKEHFMPANSDARNVTIKTLTPKTCVIVPPSVDRSPVTFAQSQVGMYSGMNISQDFAPKAAFQRAVYHEIWNCHDGVFAAKQEADEPTREKDPKGYAYDVHRSRMFAEVAALLTLASKGETDIIRQQGDITAMRAEYNSDHFTKLYSKRVDYEYYAAAIFSLTTGIDAVAKHVEKEGLDKVKAYSFQDIERIATDITEKNALSQFQFVALTDYHADKNGTLDRLAKSAVPKDKETEAFLKATIKRAGDAKDRMTAKGAVPDGISFDGIYTDEVHWSKIDPAFKASMTAEVSDRMNALKTGQKPEIVLLEMLDGYRAALQTEKDRSKMTEIENKLLFLRTFVAIGQFRRMAVDHDAAVHAAAVAASNAPAPAPKPVDSAVKPPATP